MLSGYQPFCCRCEGRQPAASEAGQTAFYAAAGAVLGGVFTTE